MLMATSEAISPLASIGSAVRNTSSGGGMRNGLNNTVERNCQTQTAITSEASVSTTVRENPLESVNFLDVRTGAAGVVSWR